jgi:hypothetical protein
MLHLLYIFAFTIIAFLAISNLIRSLITVSLDSQRHYSTKKSSSTERGNWGGINAYGSGAPTHPELFDERGQPINEPLLVMRSVTVEDAREQLDAIYNASPSSSKDFEEEA